MVRPVHDDEAVNHDASYRAPERDDPNGVASLRIGEVTLHGYYVDGAFVVHVEAPRPDLPVSFLLNGDTVADVEGLDAQP